MEIKDILTIDIDKLQKGMQYTFVDTGDIKLIIDNSFITPQILLFTPQEKYNWNLDKEGLGIATKYLKDAFAERKQHKDYEKKFSDIRNKYKVADKLVDECICGFTFNNFDKIEIGECCDDYYSTELSKEEIWELVEMLKEFVGLYNEIELREQEE